jgi:hypothetical protein
MFGVVNHLVQHVDFQSGCDLQRFGCRPVNSAPLAWLSIVRHREHVIIGRYLATGLERNVDGLAGGDLDVHRACAVVAGH